LSNGKTAWIAFVFHAAARVPRRQRRLAMHNLIFDVSDNLCESITKSRAVIDLLRVADHQNLADETLADVGWLLEDELKRMQEQIKRLSPKPDN
jgi:hypothetical protein